MPHLQRQRRSSPMEEMHRCQIEENPTRLREQYRLHRQTRHLPSLPQLFLFRYRFSRLDIVNPAAVVQHEPVRYSLDEPQSGNVRPYIRVILDLRVSRLLTLCFVIPRRLPRSTARHPAIFRIAGRLSCSLSRRVSCSFFISLFSFIIVSRSIFRFQRCR